MKYSLRHKSSGSLYPYIVPSGHLMYWGFFQKVYVNNRHLVPTDKPVLLAANHPTAFIDPCLLCTYLDPPLYNMTRGDIFRKPIFRNLLESINMFPVFRTRDGYNQRDRNEAVFNFCMEKLREKQVVTIYVEGEHHLEKRVRPAQKGIAFIAFRAYFDEGIKDLLIIPAGCNYVSGEKPRDVAMVNIGQPFSLDKYAEIYQRTPQEAANMLCRDIESSLKEICFHIEDSQDALLAERLLVLHRSEMAEALLPVVQYNHPRFAGEKALLDDLNRRSSAEKENIQKEVATYFEALEHAGIDDFSLWNARKGHWVWGLYFLLLFPVFVVGYLCAWPVMAVARGITRRFVRKKEFETSVWMGSGHLFGMSYYFLLFVAALISWRPVLIAFVLAMPWLGWYQLHYREHFKRWRGMRRALALKNRERLLQLRPYRRL